MRIRLLIAAFLMCGIGCGTEFSTAAVAGARSGCLDLGGNIQSGNRCRVYASTSNYLIDMRYATDYVDQQAVTGFLAAERDRVVNMAHAPGAKLLPYGLFLTSDSYGSGQNLSTTRAGLGYGDPRTGGPGDNEAKAIKAVVLEGQGYEAFTDCAYTKYGLSAVTDDSSQGWPSTAPRTYAVATVVLSGT